MSRKQYYAWLAASFVFAFLVIYYMLTPLFVSPGHFMLNPSGDGGKNYYAYLYQSLYGKGVWFNGMNYPYGEHVVYTDNQPVLALLVSYLRHIVPVDANTALGIMHISIAMGYILAIVICYKILIEWRVRPWLAILFSSIIIVMSPQVLRLTGHYSLSHAFYIPLLIYLLLKYHNTRKYKYLTYLFVANILMTFMHPYFLGITLALCGFYFVAYFIFSGKSVWGRFKEGLPVLISVLGSALVVKLILLATDPLKDRPTAPYGTLVYLTECRDFLTSAFSPIWQTIRAKDWYTDLSSGGEGYSYIGIVPIVVSAITIITGLIMVMIYAVKRRGMPDRKLSASVYVWLFIAFASLCIACGIPFKWNAIWIFHYMPPLRQFRTLGRFSWVFYYIITLFTAVCLSRYYEWILSRKRILAYVFIAAPLCTWGLEAKGYLERMKTLEANYANDYNWFFFKNDKNWEDFLGKHGYKPSDFQAIITLPFTHIGSDKLWVNTDNTWNMVLAYKASFELHLPMVDAYMSRTSWDEAEKQVRIAGGPWADKPLLRISDNRPFLLLKIDMLDIGDDQDYLLTASDSIGHFSQFYVYSCYPDRIRANDAAHRNEVKPIYKAMKAGDTCIGCAGTWYVNHYDNTATEQHLFGKGAQETIPKEDTVIGLIPVKPAYNDEKYEISFWSQLEKGTYMSPYIMFSLLDSNNKEVASGAAVTKESTDNASGLWFRASKYFNMPGTTRKIKITLHNEQPRSYLKLDELMIRPAEATIISKDAYGNVMINNHVYKP